MRGRVTKWTLLFAGFIFFSFHFSPFFILFLTKQVATTTATTLDYFNLKEEAEGELDLPFHCLLEMKLKNVRQKKKKKTLKRMFLKYKHDYIVFGKSLF